MKTDETSVMAFVEKVVWNVGDCKCSRSGVKED